MSGAALFGVGSRFAVEVEETCRRLAIEVQAHIANVEGEIHVGEPPRLVMPTEVAEWARTNCDVRVYIVPLTPGHRLAIVRELDALGLVHRPSLVDPSAVVASSAGIGEGVFINAAAVLAAMVTVGDYATVNRAANIGHHSKIGRFAAIGPGAALAGSVTVGDGAFIGAGAVIAPGVSIGENSVIAAGGVVGKDVPAHSIVAGNPARKVREGIAGYNGVGV